jgi:hypothetical protein
MTNTGTTAATIIPHETLYYGYPDTRWVANKGFTWTWTTGSATIEPGEQASFNIAIPINMFFQGLNMEFKIHTASGNYYPTRIAFP